MFYTNAVDVIFNPSINLVINTQNHKVCNWHEIPGVFIDSEYGFLSYRKNNTKYNLSILTTNKTEIYAIRNEQDDKISYTRYYIRKSPDSNAVQFKYDIYNSEGINKPDTITLLVYKEVKTFSEKLIKRIEQKHPKIIISKEQREDVILDFLSDILIEPILLLEDSIKKEGDE